MVGRNDCTVAALHGHSIEDVRRRRKSHPLTVAAWLITTFLLAGSGVSAASAVGDSLYLPALGARALGMGGTSVASTRQLSTAASNPALLVYQSPWRTAVDYRHLSPRISGISMFGVKDWESRGLMFGLGVNGIRANRQIWPESRSIVRNWIIQPTASVAGRVWNDVSVGLTLKPTWWQLYREDPFTFEADLGASYPTRWREIDFVVGGVARDVMGAEVPRQGADTALDMSLILGVTGRYFTSDSLWEATAAAEVEAVEQDYVGSPQGRFRLGGELAYYGWGLMRLAGRTGYDSEHLSFGLGFEFRFVELDWAKSAWEKWGHGQAVSITVKPLEFWDWFEDKVGGNLPLVNWRDSLPVYRAEQYNHYQGTARSRYNGGQYDTAYVRYHNALVFADSVSQADSSRTGLQAAGRALDSLRAEAETVFRATLLDSLLNAERLFGQSQQSELLAQADSCFRRRDYQCALDLIDMVLAVDPANADALALKGDVDKGRDLEIVFSLVLADSAERDNRLGKALEAYLRILELDSTHVDGDQGKGRIENKLEALRYARRALVLYDQGRPAAARAAFDSAVVKDATLHSVRTYLVATHDIQADTVSLDEIERDTTVYANYLTGLQFHSDQKYQQAMDAFFEVLRVYPNCEAVRKEYIEAREMRNQSGQDSTQ